MYISFHSSICYTWILLSPSSISGCRQHLYISCQGMHYTWTVLGTDQPLEYFWVQTTLVYFMSEYLLHMNSTQYNSVPGVFLGADNVLTGQSHCDSAVIKGSHLGNYYIDHYMRRTWSIKYFFVILWRKNKLTTRTEPEKIGLKEKEKNLPRWHPSPRPWLPSGLLSSCSQPGSPGIIVIINTKVNLDCGLS